MRIQIRYCMLATIFVFAISLVLFCQWATQNFNYFAIRNISYIRFEDLHGDNLAAVISNIYNAFPNEKIAGYFNVREPEYIIRDPNILLHLSVDAADHFEDHLLYFNGYNSELFASGLHFMRGNKWKAMRENLSPVFGHSHLGNFFDMVAEIAQTVVQNLQAQHFDNKRVNWDIKDLFTRSISDTLSNVVFGVKTDSIRNNTNFMRKVGLAVDELTHPGAVYKILLFILFPRSMETMGISLVNKKAQDFFKLYALKEMNERIKNRIYRPDIINYILEMRKENMLPNTKNYQQDNSTDEPYFLGKWSDTDLIAQCFTFFSTGYGTLTYLLTFASYEIAINPNIHHRLYNEIKKLDQSLHGRALNYNDLKSLEYMDQVLSETLRKWPTAAITDRIATKSYTLDLDGRPIYFEKGIGYVIPIYALHNDPKYFPNPQVFDPDRFSVANKSNIVPGTYLPFGIGPRSCIAKHFSLMVVKTVLYHLLLKFSMVPNEQTQRPLQLESTYVALVPLDGIFLDFKLRP